GSVQAMVTPESTPGVFQADFHGGGFDGFLVKLDRELTQYSYFTYLGGSGSDVIMDLDVNDGFAFVTGSTRSVDFPTSDLAFQTQRSEEGTGVNCAGGASPRQCFDAFVARFARDGSDVVYSTLIGGDREEFARGIAVATNNQATITGAARSTSDGTTE